MRYLIDLNLIKRILLVFWASWLSIVVVTNVLNALQAIGVVPLSFPFVSGNWAAINQVMDPLRLPRPLQGFFFLSAIAMETLAASLYWRAVAAFRGRPFGKEGEALIACLMNLVLWCLFQLLDEVLLAYAFEGVHRMIFLSQLATIVVLCVPSDWGNSMDAQLASRLAAFRDSEVETQVEPDPSRFINSAGPPT
jgi:hypothetical protein